MPHLKIPEPSSVTPAIFPESIETDTLEDTCSISVALLSKSSNLGEAGDEEVISHTHESISLVVLSDNNLAPGGQLHEVTAWQAQESISLVVLSVNKCAPDGQLHELATWQVQLSISLVFLSVNKCAPGGQLQLCCCATTCCDTATTCCDTTTGPFTSVIVPQVHILIDF